MFLALFFFIMVIISGTLSLCCSTVMDLLTWLLFLLCFCTLNSFCICAFVSDLLFASFLYTTSTMLFSCPVTNCMKLLISPMIVVIISCVSCPYILAWSCKSNMSWINACDALSLSIWCYITLTNVFRPLLDSKESRFYLVDISYRMYFIFLMSVA